MPKTTSAKKALRQNITNRERNLKNKRALKASIKEIKTLALSDIKQAKEKLSSAYQIIDKVAKTNYINKKKASRLKSRLALRLGRASAKNKV